MSTERIVTNPELQDELQWRIDRWGGNPGATLRLFRNDLEPTPATNAGDVLEANFLGYSPVLLMGQLGAPTLIAAGEYESITPAFQFQPPASGPGNMIYGFYIYFGAQVVGISRFLEPVPLEIGGQLLSLRLRVRSVSESVYFESQ